MAISAPVRAGAHTGCCGSGQGGGPGGDIIAAGLVLAGQTASKAVSVPAQGAIAQVGVLGGGREARLSGHRFLNLPQVHPGEAAAGRLALRPVRHFQDRLAAEGPGRPEADS